MSFGQVLRNVIDRMLKAAVIVSPRFSDYRVDHVFETADIGVDDAFRIEVVRVIKEEIGIQMTRQAEDIGEKQNPIGSVDSQIASNIQKGIGISQNPASIATNLMSKLPHTALVLLAVSLAPMIISELTRAGGLMDIRFRRAIEKEWNGFLDRQTQKNTQIGLRSMIVQSAAGFIQINGAASGNAQRIAKNTQGFIEKKSEIGLPAHVVRFDGL